MKTCLIDGKYLLYRSLSANMVLTHNDVLTSMHYFFLSTIKSVVKKFNCDKTIILWDSIKSARRKIYPTYKEKDPPKDSNVKKQMIMIRKEYKAFRKDMKDLGFASYISPFIEADDLFKHYIDSFPNEEIIIVSRDGDLYQLFNGKKVVMYNPDSKKILNESWLKNEHGLTPDQWIMYKAINGCNSDNVKGIPGVGPKTTIKYLTGTASAKEIEKIKNNWSIVETNIPLVKIPFDTGFKILYNLYPKNTHLNVEKFIDLCQKYGFRSFLEELEEWKKLFIKE